MGSGGSPKNYEIIRQSAKRIFKNGLIVDKDGHTSGRERMGDEITED